MNVIRARVAAIVASFLLAQLATRGLVEVSPELAASVERWVDHSLELLMLGGYAVVHPWMQKRWNPTGTRPPVAWRRRSSAPECRAVDQERVQEHMNAPGGTADRT